MLKFTHLVFIAFLFLSLPVSAQQPLQARIEKSWTVETAKQEAFNGAKQWVDLSWASPTDPNWRENFRAACSQGLITYEDRQVEAFYDPDGSLESYGVTRYDDNKAFRYDIYGKLFAVTFFEFNENISTFGEHLKTKIYPTKAYMHSYQNGKLVLTGLSTSYRDNYGFYPTGELASHCINDTCYDATGQIIGTRELLTAKP